MMTWNSQSSYWTDIILGVVPATALLMYCMAVLVIATSFYSMNPQNQALQISILSIPGLTSSLTLIYTTTTREAARFRIAVIASFMIGMICAAVMTKYMFTQHDLQNTLIYLVPTLSMTGIAIKHIYLLTRA